MYVGRLGTRAFCATLYIWHVKLSCIVSTSDVNFHYKGGLGPIGEIAKVNH
jgi:hypothetical protein